MKRWLVVLVLLVALVAAVPLFADNTVHCSDFPVGPVTGAVPGDIIEANVVPAGTYHRLIVDSHCYLSTSVNVSGKVIEPGITEWSIIVDPQATVYGGIQEQGPGDVLMTVGHDEIFSGTVTEAGPGDIWLWVDGLFRGGVKESGDGGLVVVVFGGPPAGGPGTFKGSAVEQGNGDAVLSIQDHPELPGDFNGSFREKGDGECTVIQPPTGTITCK